MPDNKDPKPLPKAHLRELGSSDGVFVDDPINLPTRLHADIILPNGLKSTKYKSGLTPYSDPFFSGGIDTSYEGRSKVMSDGLDSVQPWYDKLGNGIVKFGGSLTDGILSTAGTIYGIPASLITWDKTELWDNPFTKLGSEINDLISENFVNHQSLSEQNANAWNPKYWFKLNFFADNILGNLGYAASAYVTGFGVSRLLGKLAPYIAGRNLKAGLDIVKNGGIEALVAESGKAYSAVKRWDGIQQGISLGISAGGESSVEAYGASKEYKEKAIQDAIDKYGGIDFIPDSVMASIESQSKEIGNMVYALNLPILAGADFIQWGKALSPFRSEFSKYSKNALKVNAATEFATYSAKQDLVKKGVMGAIMRGGRATGKALKSNFAEAGQEGLQYIAATGTKNWYHRKDDPKGWADANDFMDPYLVAARDLFTTKEGVSNLLGGFAGGAPFGIKDYYRALVGDPTAKKHSDEILSKLNNPFGDNSSVRQNLKIYMQNMARHASAQRDLDQSLQDGDENGARNAKFDQLKTYINSRIMTGRMDLLENEINQISALSEEEFKKFFNLEETDNITKDAILSKFKNTAKDMHDTYKKIDRLFMPDMYKLNNLSEEAKKEKLGQLSEYKSMLWSYLMDYKDRDHRAKTIDAELTKTLGGIINMNTLMEDKFTSSEMNDLYRQWVAASTELALNKQAHESTQSTKPGASRPIYNETEEAKKIQELLNKIKAKMQEVSGGNIASKLSIEDYIGEGKKDYVENYLFNLDKMLMPALSNPAVQAAMQAEDINSIITKVHDLATIHRERRQAIYAYNQLGSAIKTGKFADRFIDNPEYDEKIPEFIQDDTGKEINNPEYKRKRIPSDDMLKYDGYKDSLNMRKDFYQEQKELRKKNAEEAADFEKQLNDTTTLDEDSPHNAEFVQLYKENVFGGPGVKVPVRGIKLSDLHISEAIAQRNIDTAYRNGEFDTDTVKARREFNRRKYLSLHARLLSIRGEIARRKEERRKIVEKDAKTVVAYVKENKISVTEVKPGLKLSGIEIPHDVVKRAREILDEEIRKKEEKDEADRLEKEAKLRAAVAARDAKAAAKAGDEKETIVTDEMWNYFLANGKFSNEAKEILHSEITSKSERGEELTYRESVYYNLYKTAIDKKLDARKSGRRPILPKSKAGILVQPEPSSTSVDNPDLIQEGVGKGEKENKKTEYVGEPGFIKMRRQDVKFDWESKENQYDKDGLVEVNMLRNFSVFADVRSPMNFNKRPVVRFTAYHGKNGVEQAIHIEVSPDGGKTFEWIGYYLQGKLDKDGKEIPMPAGMTKDRWDAYNATLDQIRNTVKENGFAYGEIKGTPSLGKLVFNRKGADGKSERMGLRKAMGTAPFNTPSNQYSVQFGIMYNDSPTAAQIVIPSPTGTAGELVDINDVPGFDIPRSLINSIAGLRLGTAGKLVALVPTGRLNKEGTAQERFPVLMNGSLLNKHVTTAYDFGEGAHKSSQANMAEVLIDALLSPFKDEHQQLMQKMFEDSNLEYHGLDDPKTDWSEFYTPENINRLVNKLFFASGLRTRKGEYSLPFNFEVVERGGKDGNKPSIAIRVGISDTMLKSSSKKEVDIFILSKDGRVIKPTDKSKNNTFTQDRINDEIQYRKDNDLEEKGELSYEEIQTVLKQKSFRTPIEELGARTMLPYKGFVFDSSGKMTMRDYKDYVEYSDELDIHGSTIQGVRNNHGQQQFFINQEVYFSPKATIESFDDELGSEEETELTEPTGDKVSNFEDLEKEHEKSLLDIKSRYKSTRSKAYKEEVEKAKADYEAKHKALTDQLKKTAGKPSSGIAAVTGTTDNPGNPFLTKSKMETPRDAFPPNPLAAASRAIKRKPMPMLVGPNLNTVIKPEIAELFESNPELASSVYEALGVYDKSYSKSGLIEVNGQKYRLSVNINDGNLKLDFSLPNDYGAGAVTPILNFGLKQINDLFKTIYEKVNPLLSDYPVKNIIIGESNLQGDIKAEQRKSLYLRELKKHFPDITLSQSVKEQKQYLGGDVYSLGTSTLTLQQKQQAQQLYSQYLDTIFPNSKVKDIVYHASEGELEGGNFDTNKAIIKSGFIFFTPKKTYAEEFMIGPTAKMNTAILDIKNPYYQKSNEQNALSNSLKSLPKEYDGVIHSIDEKFLDSEERIVRTPEQIHILGSKQDIKGFKNWVSQKSLPMQTAPNNENPVGDLLENSEIVKAAGLNKVFEADVVDMIKKDEIKKDCTN